MISFQLPVNSHLRIKIYDVLGREVMTFLDEFKVAGYYEAQLDAYSLSSGVYFYQLNVVDQSGRNFVERKKMMLLR